MIYTIGYQGLPFDRFKEILVEKDINIIVDVRSKPYGRAFQYNRKALEFMTKDTPATLLYWYKGDVLGGFNPIKPEALKWLESIGVPNGKEFGPGFKVPDVPINYLILCYEANPRECHRHYELAKHLMSKGIAVVHLDKAGSETRAADLEPQPTLL